MIPRGSRTSPATPRSRSHGGRSSSATPSGMRGTLRKIVSNRLAPTGITFCARPHTPTDPGWVLRAPATLLLRPDVPQQCSTRTARTAFGTGTA